MFAAARLTIDCYNVIDLLLCLLVYSQRSTFATTKNPRLTQIKKGSPWRQKILHSGLF